MKTRSTTVFALGACLIAQACVAYPSDSGSVVPVDIKAFVAPTDTLLAYKAADLYGDAKPAAVIVVRHVVTGKSDYDFDNNPCELVVLHQVNGKLATADSSKRAVDCTYNDVARNAPAMSLNDNLIAKTATIVYVNQKTKGDSTLYFAWSKEKNTWYLQRVTASNPDGVTIANVSASYPKDFGWTTMSGIDPEAMANVLEKRAKNSK